MIMDDEKYKIFLDKIVELTETRKKLALSILQLARSVEISRLVSDYWPADKSDTRKSKITFSGDLIRNPRGDMIKMIVHLYTGEDVEFPLKEVPFILWPTQMQKDYNSIKRKPGAIKPKGPFPEIFF